MHLVFEALHTLASSLSDPDTDSFPDSLVIEVSLDSSGPLSNISSPSSSSSSSVKNTPSVSETCFFLVFLE